jgi:hypothetical protein
MAEEWDKAVPEVGVKEQKMNLCLNREVYDHFLSLVTALVSWASSKQEVSMET